MALHQLASTEIISHHKYNHHHDLDDHHPHQQENQHRILSLNKLFLIRQKLPRLWNYDVQLKLLQKKKKIILLVRKNLRRADDVDVDVDVDDADGKAKE